LSARHTSEVQWESLEKEAQLVLQVHKALKVLPAQLDHQEQMDNQDKEECQDFLVIPDVMVSLVGMEIQALLVHLEKRVLWVQWVQLV
jgi:hypothetical protein